MEIPELQRFCFWHICQTAIIIFLSQSRTHQGFQCYQEFFRGASVDPFFLLSNYINDIPDNKTLQYCISSISSIDDCSSKKMCQHLHPGVMSGACNLTSLDMCLWSSLLPHGSNCLFSGLYGVLFYYQGSNCLFSRSNFLG